MITPDKSLQVEGYTISGELFTKGYPAGGGPCQCSSACCEGGVFVDLRERDAILAHRESISAQMDETQNRDPATWFEKEELEDSDFPSGSCIGTRIINDKCTFLDGSGRCTLQRTAIARGMHKWALKPIFCVLYPIEIASGVVSFDEMLQNDQACCTVSNAFELPLFEACREELVHLVGEEGFAAMQNYYATLNQSGGPR
ncbi:MAG TPA: DUF3109 family protein [Bacteroidota bacterium]|nr:DUF3109 family protein [Bacteroidota bacterium]